MTMVETEAPAQAQMALLGRLADGLDVLIRFHDSEVDNALLSEMAAHNVAAGFSELMTTDEGQADTQAFHSALTDLGPHPDDAVMDDLSANYADLFLTHGYRVAPSASVWLTEDKLERQQPMFDVRDWYAHYDVTVPNWRVRADDHLVHELQFVSFLCRQENMVAAVDAGRFLDLHVLSWVPDFCTRAEERVRAPLYAALMALTRSYLEELRTTLEMVTGQERTEPKRPAETVQPEEEAPYIPGTSESW